MIIVEEHIYEVECVKYVVTAETCGEYDQPDFISRDDTYCRVIYNEVIPLDLETYLDRSP